MNDKKNRRKRYIQKDTPKGIRLTSRDEAVIEAIYRYRVLDTKQIKQLFFANVGRRVAERRLERLFDHEYLVRRRPPPNANILNPMASAILYLLGKRGNQFLLSNGYDEVRWNPRHNTVGYEHLEHLMAINNVRIAVEIACHDSEIYQLDKWIDDTTLKQNSEYVRLSGLRKPVAVIPDGYFRLTLPDGDVHFFLELDRANMESKRIKRKVRAYLAYRGQAERRFGSSKFRVLFVTTSQKRLLNMKKATEDAKGKTRFWFTTIEDLSSNSVLNQEIWHVSGRDITYTLL